MQYLTQLLLPLLRDTQDSQPSSVVSVSSNAAFYSYDVGVRLSKEAINDPSTYANSETAPRCTRGELARTYYARLPRERQPGRQDLRDTVPGGIRHFRRYSPVAAYGQSKLANILFAQHLAEARRFP